MKKLIAGLLILFLVGANPAAIAASQINTATPLSSGEISALQSADQGQLDAISAGQRAGGGVLLAVIIVAAAVAVLVAED
jgi:hypothetical protein